MLLEVCRFGWPAQLYFLQEVTMAWWHLSIQQSQIFHAVQLPRHFYRRFQGTKWSCKQQWQHCGNYIELDAVSLQASTAYLQLWQPRCPSMSLPKSKLPFPRFWLLPCFAWTSKASFFHDFCLLWMAWSLQQWYHCLLKLRFASCWSLLWDLVSYTPSSSKSLHGKILVLYAYTGPAIGFITLLLCNAASVIAFSCLRKEADLNLRLVRGSKLQWLRVCHAGSSFVGSLARLVSLNQPMNIAQLLHSGKFYCRSCSGA